MFTVNGVPPTKIVRRARSFGRVAPSRMTARTGARSAPLRGLAVFYSSAVAINQSKRLCTKGHLAEGSFRGGSSAAGGEGVPFPKAKLIFLLTKFQVLRKYIFEFKSQCRFLRRSLHVVQVLSVPLCCTTKTSSRWRSLRLTC